ncbi:MAG: alpha/beta hydrolase [Rhizobiaceae bacterium]|nr:alpha/beta hydrolase [Rhizobiaceae bacterium]
MTAGAHAGTAMSPVALRRGFGLLHHDRTTGGQGIGVVLCSAWGIPELSSRKMMFRLADRLAAGGLPTIRFDYPGTADRIDEPADGFEAWVAAALDAADALKTVSGVTRLAFAGIGIGAMVAALAAARHDDVAGLVLAAPVVSGRRYLREIALAAPVVEEGLGLDANSRPPGVSIGGIVMPPLVATDLKSIDLNKAELAAQKPVLAVLRPSQPQETELIERLKAMGWPAERTEFEGYDAAMDNPTLSVMPDLVLARISAWLASLAGASQEEHRPLIDPGPVVIDCPGYRERLELFGGRLFGLSVLPARRRSASCVVFLNSGYDYHAGWAYQWVRAARMLSASGIASLRFDMGNIGDSAAAVGAPDQILYSDWQQRDIDVVLDDLAARGETSIILVGRCSGAYAAFHATARDRRVKAAVLINQLRLVWDPDENIDVTLRAGPRTMADYRRRALSGRTLKRLWSGDINVLAAARGLATLVFRQIMRRVAPFLGSFAKITRLRRQCHAMMTAVSERGASLQFVSSEGDESLEQLAHYFGADLHGLQTYPGVSLTIVPNADHNMTPEPAQDKVLELIRETAMRFPARTATGAPAETEPTFAGSTPKTQA